MENITTITNHQEYDQFHKDKNTRKENKIIKQK